jgi:hypothetical protein
MLLARKLGVDVPAGPAATTALWTRLARPEPMFSALVELLAEGGQGALLAGLGRPYRHDRHPADDDFTDPSGMDASANALLGLYGAVSLEA